MSLFRTKIWSTKQIPLNFCVVIPMAAACWDGFSSSKKSKSDSGGSSNPSLRWDNVPELLAMKTLAVTRLHGGQVAFKYTYHESSFQPLQVQAFKIVCKATLLQKQTSCNEKSQTYQESPESLNFKFFQLVPVCVHYNSKVRFVRASSPRRCLPKNLP